MRLRNKIKELKQQHAELRQMKEAQQQQLLASAETPEGQTHSDDQIEAQEQRCTSELSEKIASDLEAMSCETASDVSEQSSAEL